jgi:HTH-type transcriptional regulator/antitoxin HigA
MGSIIDNDRYKQVLAMHLPKPIKSDEDCDRWADLLEAIAKSASPTPEQEALVELMNILMVEYRRSRNPELPVSDPLATLKALMQANNVRPVDLSRLLGVSRSAASQILHGKRGISKAAALKLADRFCVPVSLFLAARSTSPDGH